jgi:phospholipase C
MILPEGGRTMTSSGQASAASALDNIQNVIVLMFENRSFDHLLGAMPKVDGLLNSAGVVNPEFYNTKKPLEPINETQGPDYNPPFRPMEIVPKLGNELLPNNEATVFCGNDFNHDFSLGMLNDLYGPAATGIIAGQPIPPDQKPTWPKTNSGFLSSPGNHDGPSPIPGVMSYFQWNSMQVFHTLAQNFVVCDAWRCDMPGHTAPNRAFMHCATTGSLGIDDNDDAASTPYPGPQGFPIVDRLTIYEQIQNYATKSNNPKFTWKMYWPGGICDTDWLNAQVFSQQYENNPNGSNVTQVPIANLFKDLKSGNLPFYSFIMCWNDVGPDTSMHPNAIVESGENLLACVYNALQASSYWGNTLLIVNFDENGGLYDHRGVLPASRPDPFDPILYWQWPSDPKTYAFDFSVLGPRTPVLLISPWLAPGICNKQLQNTSILRFVQDLMTPSQLGSLSLTERDRHALSVAPVFGEFGVQTMRTDCPTNLALYTSTFATRVITEKEIIDDSDPTAEQLAARPAPHIVKVTKKYLAGLPGHPDSGKPITRIFTTVGEMRAYAKERRDAALAEIRKGRAG